eukprot:743006-Prymnesium_polylepis.1
MRAVAVTARDCRSRWTTRSWMGHVARCGRWAAFAAPQPALCVVLLTPVCADCALLRSVRRTKAAGSSQLSFVC